MQTRLSFFAAALLLPALLAAEPYPDRLPIGTVQGRVTNADDGLRHRSPLTGETVIIRGVVHQMLRWRASAGHELFGIMVQDLPAEADGDPLSSDGIFVYIGGEINLRTEDQGVSPLELGDIVTLRGVVNERFGQTELSEAVLLERRSGGDVDALLPPTPLELSIDPAETHRILERHEGMRVSLNPGATTVSGSFPNNRNADYQIWITPAENPNLAAPRAAERRLFRGPHPLSGVPEEHRLDGHGMRVVLGSLGLRGRTPEGDQRLPPWKTGTVFPGELTGGIQYSFGNYILQVEHLPEWRGGESPATWHLPVPEGSKDRLRIATYNIENLYDFVDDPFSDVDFHTNPGTGHVRPPFTYLHSSDAEYREQLRIVADQIIHALRAPQILMLQEMENQDIAVLTPDGMVFGTVNDADGELDAVQELILEIVAQGGPVYGSAVNRNAGDLRGIITAFLYCPDTFEPLPAEAGHPVLGENPDLPLNLRPFAMNAEVANPKAFNFYFEAEAPSDLSSVFSRAVQVFGLRETAESGRILWLLNNHFSARPDQRTERRTLQADVNAAIAATLKKHFPEDGVILGGDLNHYARPDDPFWPPLDQLGSIYNAGMLNTYDWIIERDPANAYSYVFRAHAGTLDHLFLSPNLRERLVWASFLHINADFPDAPAGELPLRGSDHDPLLIELDW
ncbi:MAG: hypothetical protein JJU05_06705 [Verrucomicrobia bacterium]|nr:hypothetical protein [Verrucomicrobiota bacterium]MCH8527063.1 hypothetical protein [Kiritimatiellia bacterium]